MSAMRVLLVEDSEDDALLLVQELRRGGLEPDWQRVDSAAAMQSALSERPWDVILSDYSIPGFGGPAALALLQDSGLDLPFLLVSGAIGEERAAALLRAGAHDFISKGNLARLVPAVRRELEQAGQRRARRCAEEQLRLLGTAVTTVANAIFITDHNGVIQWANPAFAELSGYSVQELIGETPRRLKSGRQSTTFYQKMWETILAGQVWSGEVVDSRKDGSFYVVHQTITPIRDAAGAITNFVAIHEDITSSKESEARLQYLAYHDTLTGLPNRLLLQDRMGQSIAAARRKQCMLAVHFIDLDQFKVINDTLGHAQGDILLKSVAERLRGCIRETDTLARLGGDEFAVLQGDLRRADGAATLAHKLCTAFVPPFVLCGQEFRVTASIGVTVFPLDDSDGGQLLQNADMAMYLAKEDGRNRYRFYTPALQTAVQTRYTLESELSRALEEGQFLLHYQPQMDLRAGGLVGMEALLRWRHPLRGLLYPGEFLAVTEETGLIIPLSQRVLTEACRCNCAWQAAGLPPARMAVNISSTCLTGELVPLVTKVLQTSGLPPQYLELELTETTLMRDAGVAVSVLDALHQMGVLLSIDDFGTGYSSLNYLKRLPVHRLKVDQSFVRQLPDSKDDTVIVRATIELAHGLGLKVIAEGVETRAQMDFLREHGCDEVQGFYISEPLPAEECVCFLEKQKHRASPC